MRQFTRAYSCRILAVHILSLFSDSVRILSPRLHDDIRGITFHASPVTGGYSLLPVYVKQFLESNDLLRVGLLSSAQAVTVLLTMYYEGLSDAQTNYIGAAELEARTKNIRSVQYSSAGILFDRYTNQASLSDGLFKADRDYALLGFHGEGTEGFLRVKAFETGKFSIGFPAFSFDGSNSNYFARLSRTYGDLACVPVISGENISTAVVEAIGMTDVNGTIFFAELAP